MLNQKLKPDEESILKEYLEKLENNFEINAVILFGSITKGKSNYKSDIDLLIISDHMGARDFIIGTQAQIDQAKLITFNTKHFLWLEKDYLLTPDELVVKQ